MITALSVSEDNLSIAWAKAFLDLMSPGGGQRHPAVVSINNVDRAQDIEVPAIRSRLDDELRLSELNLCGTVAGTLFPYSMWNPNARNDAQSLYARYSRAWPAIAKCPANRNGVYFRRLTAYAPTDYEGKPVNQLQYMVNTFRQGNHRRSALQASILDPTRDHTDNRQKGFPCLQQVAFTPLGDDKMGVTGYYATQYQFEKAYGNYLGLYRLGLFMAKQLNLQLVQVVCFASFLSLGDRNKADLRSLEKDLRLMVPK